MARPACIVRRIEERPVWPGDSTQSVVKTLRPFGVDPVRPDTRQAETPQAINRRRQAPEAQRCFSMS